MVSEIDVAEAMRRAESGAAMLLDVREDEEWTAGHAPQAEHVPLGELDADAFAGKGAVVVICKAGGRSSVATQALVDAGADAVNVAGGMMAWESAGQPVLRDDGSAGTVV